MTLGALGPAAPSSTRLALSTTALPLEPLVQLHQSTEGHRVSTEASLAALCEASQAVHGAMPGASGE